MNDSCNFSEILGLLSSGELIARKSWNGSKIVCRQVPSEIYCNIIPKMSSLTSQAKEKLYERNQSLLYKSQLIEIFADNSINSWSPSADDLFANDWFVC